MKKSRRSFLGPSIVLFRIKRLFTRPTPITRMQIASTNVVAIFRGVSQAIPRRAGIRMPDATSLAVFVVVGQGGADQENDVVSSAFLKIDCHLRIHQLEFIDGEIGVGDQHIF